MSINIRSFPEKNAAPWFGVDLATWNSRIQSAFGKAKNAALRENEELQEQDKNKQEIANLNIVQAFEKMLKLQEEQNQRLASLEHALENILQSRAQAAQSSVH